MTTQRGRKPITTHVVPTLQPFMLLASGLSAYRETVTRDFRFARELLKRNPHWTQRGSIVFPTLDEIAELIAEVRRCGETLTVDLETIGGHPLTAQIRCAGIGYSKRAVVVWFLSEGGVPYWKKPRDERRARELLRNAFTDPALPKGGQNFLLYDQPVIENDVNRLGPVRGDAYDVMIAHHVGDPELPHGLDYITSRFTELAYYKSMVADPDAKGNEKWASIKNDVLGNYNVKDVLATARARPGVEGLLNWERGRELYELELQVAAELRELCRAGLWINEKCRAELEKELHATEEKHLKIMRKILRNREFNPNSVVVLREALFVKLKFPILNTRDARTKKGAPSTAKQALFELSLRAEGPQEVFIKSVSAHRKARKLRGTYTRLRSEEHGGLEVFPDGRVHPTWRNLTKSGRYACTPAVNTLPKKVKKIYEAEAGNELGGIDLSQAELRSMAKQAAVKTLLEAYSRGADVHSLNMVTVFEVRGPAEFEKSDKWNKHTEKMLDELVPGCPADCRDPQQQKVLGRTQCPAHPFWRTFEIDPNAMKTRDLTKRGVFASNYMATLETVWRSLRAEVSDKTGELLFPDLPKHQVEAFMIAWFRRAPEIPKFAQERLNEAKDAGFLESKWSGRRRWFKDKLELSDAANWPIQESIAAKMNNAIVEIGPRLRKIGVRLISQVHDALFWEGPKGRKVREAGKIVHDVLNQPMRAPDGDTMTLPADLPKYGISLADL
jgi:DNA polymerase I-like protein with 3'-5' exonuclease and polymerase domains